MLPKSCGPTAIVSLPLALATVAAGHDEDTVNTVSVAVTPLVPVTVVFGSEKHPFVSGGVLETIHAIVPV